MALKGSLVITIDGPAASGKTTVTRTLAQELGWQWVSTGAFYRGLAYAALQQKVGANNEDELVNLVKLSSSQASQPLWKVVLGTFKTHVFYEGQDVTEACAQESVGTLASKVSSLPRVREALLKAQRDCSSGQGLVAEGRDCGSVVFPRAELKIFLTAEPESRAERRAKELGLSKEAMKTAQRQRDEQDASRAAAPMTIPAEALVIDSSQMPLEEVVQRILQKWQELNTKKS